MGYYYERYNPVTGKMDMAPGNDYDGKITGRCVFNLKAWFDENPEARKRLGYIKHITEETRDIQYNRASQYLEITVVAVDEYTVKDVHYIADKSEEMLAMEEMWTRLGYSANRGIVFAPIDEETIGFGDFLNGEA